MLYALGFRHVFANSQPQEISIMPNGFRKRWFRCTNFNPHYPSCSFPFHCDLAQNIFEHQLRESYGRDKKGQCWPACGTARLACCVLCSATPIPLPLCGLPRLCRHHGAPFAPTRGGGRLASLLELSALGACSPVRVMTTEQQRWFMHGCLAHCGVAPIHAETKEWLVRSYVPETAAAGTNLEQQ